jgi:hypothetical protein
MELLIQILPGWAHVFLAIVMVGGAVGGKYLNVDGVSALSRKGVIGAIALMIASGLIQMMSIMANAPKGWHMWFGIKFLLALHVFAMMFLLTKPDAPEAKRNRWRLSMLIGVVAVTAIGVYLEKLRSL